MHRNILFYVSFAYLWADALSVCRSPADCGWNTECQEDGQCSCLPGYALTDNARDCYDVRCGDKACLECGNVDTCLRCIDFIERGTGRCLESCSTHYDLVVEGAQMGKVCPEGMGELSHTYLVVIISACSGVVLTGLIALLIYWRFRMYNDRKARLKFMEKMMARQKKEYEKMAQMKQLGNPAFGYKSVGSTLSREDREVLYLKQLLRAHHEDLLHMLQEAKHRLAQTPESQPKHAMYKNIVDELGRVMMLVTDDNAPLPTDANALLNWAHKLLTQYLHVNNNSSSCDQPENTQMEEDVDGGAVASPRSGRSAVTSTFRPDQQVVTSDSIENFKYQPCPALISDSVESVKQCREVSEINIVQLLADHNINAADV